MNEFFTLFFDVVWFPVDPAYLDLENNPVMLVLSMCVIGMSVTTLFKKVYYGLLGID